MITSNQPIGSWGDALSDPVVATAILDRLLHHSHVITIKGESYRLREKRRSGVVPMGEVATPWTRGRRGGVLRSGYALPPDTPAHSTTTWGFKTFGGKGFNS